MLARCSSWRGSLRAPNCRSQSLGWTGPAGHDAGLVRSTQSGWGADGFGLTVMFDGRNFAHYEGLGFRHHSGRNVGHYTVAR